MREVRVSMPDKDATVTLEVGDRVQARWKGDQKAGYFGGVVIADNGNGSFHLRFDVFGLGPGPA